MFSVVAKTVARPSARNFVLSRHFGALTQNSGLDLSLPWAGLKSADTKRSLDGRVPSNHSPQTTDAMLENLFSRQLPLPDVIRQDVSAKNLELIFPSQLPLSQEDLWSIVDPDYTQSQPIHALNRNARKPKKANKGARPCSRVGRRKKRSPGGKRSGAKC
jgi:hypothetical protein